MKAVTQTAMVAAYFGQAENYFSDNREELIPVREMHRRHAANAAEKMLRDARFFAEDAGAQTRQPMLWMAQQPLFIALTERAERA